MDIIQIGSNRGSDDLTKIIFENKERLGKVILVEPISSHHQQLKECYNEIPVIIEGIAITDDPNIRQMPLYYSRRDAPHYEIASFNKDHILNHAHSMSDILEKNVACMTINQLMDKYKMSELDLLFIDAEGFDERIIRSINFQKYKIKEIIYENLHICYKDQLIHLLNRKNYHVTPNWGFNGWSNKAVRQPFTIQFFLFILNDEKKMFFTNSKKLLKKVLIKMGLFQYFKALKNNINKNL